MMRFLSRHPTVAGLFLLVVGVVFVRDTLADAKRYDDYDAGPRVTASVTRVVPAAEEGQVSLELFWRDPEGESHRKTRTTANEEGLAERDRVKLALFPTDYSRFLYESTLDERRSTIVEVVGIRAVNTIFVGLLLVIGGLVILFVLPMLDLEPPARQASTGV